jgi:hypothetical protein
MSEKTISPSDGPQQTAWRDKPPHAKVRWRRRETPQGEDIAWFYDGDWKVTVVDQDGDRSYFEVENRKTGAKFEGEMGDHGTDRCAFDICADTAIAALRAMKRERCGDDH